MELILLQPGSDAIFGDDKNAWPDGGSLINSDNGDKNQFFGELPCIELVSLQHGMKQQVTTDVSNSARTSGRPVITEFTCVKYVDKASVKFYEYCLKALPLGAGKSEPTKIFVCSNTDEETVNIMCYSLRDALISDIQLQSNADDKPTEQFKLGFTEIIWEYSVQKGGSILGGKNTFGWSLARNRPIGDAFSD